MVEKYSQEFFSRQLNAVAPGEISLGMPAREGIVQIEAPPLVEETTHLHVISDKFGNIAVKKIISDQLLQAELVAFDPEDDESKTRLLPVFEEPIDVLRISRSDPYGSINRDLWVAKGENLAVTDIGLLEAFANMIGDCARLEQERRRRRGRPIIHNPL
jgi:hypothetical protein